MLSYGLRTIFNAVFLGRPLVMALLLGFCTNTLPTALSLGLALELFWIDSLRLGIVVPASASFSFLLIYPLCLIFQWQLPSALPVPFCLCLAFGHVASILERWQRTKNTAYDSELEQWVEQTTNVAHATNEQKQELGLSPTQIISSSNWRVLWSAATLYFASFTALYLCFSWIEKQFYLPLFPSFTWQMLYGISLVGAILALRTRRAYKFLAAYLIFLVFLAIL